MSGDGFDSAASSAFASTYCENTWKAAPTFTPFPICLYESAKAHRTS